VFGLTFLNSIFLAGLAAAVLPIVIHLFSRRRAREIEFSSLEYLREISRQKIRRMRLRQWLLLVLRVLVLAFFAMAMGRPALRGRASVVTRGSSTVAMILDNSYSMSAADPRLTGSIPVRAETSAPGGEKKAGSPIDETGTIYALAKERAGEICDLMGEGDHGSLVLAGKPVSLPFQTPVTDAGLLRQEIKRAPLAADRADLPTALSQILPVLQSARTMNKELFIISDFQKADLDAWVRAGSEGGRTGGDTLSSGRALNIPEGIKVYLVPVRESDQENATIERVRLDASAPEGKAGRIVVTILNQGDDGITDRIVRALDAGGSRQPLADALFSLPAHGRTEVNLDLAALPPDGAVEIQLGTDPLEWDNHAYLVTHDPGVRKVLLITGSPDEGHYLQTALDPTGNGEFFRVRRADPDGLGDPSVWDVDVAILSDVGRISEAGMENLKRFRSQGGGVLIGLGDRVEPRYFNTDVLSKLSSCELLNIVQDEGPGAFRSLRPTVLSHPIFAGFPVGPGDELGSARFRKLVSCRMGPAARVVAEFGRQVPALIEEQGLFFFTSDFEGQWNDFVTSASFPPLLHLMVRNLAAHGAEDQRQGLVGARLETLLPEGTVQAPVTCVDPMGGATPVEAVPVERMLRLRSPAAMIPGVYRFVDAAGKNLRSFAVNLDPKEGDLSVAGASIESRLFGRTAVRLGNTQPITRELLTGRYGRELWRAFLVVVLILLVAESLLGRGRLLS
jgi:hypothetical protein